MIPPTNQQVLNADGEYSLYAELPGREVLVEWQITAGTATVVPGYVAMSGAFRPALNVDGSSPVFADDGGECRIVIPSSGYAALKVTDAAALVMKYSQTRIIS